MLNDRLGHEVCCFVIMMERKNWPVKYRFTIQLMLYDTGMTCSCAYDDQWFFTFMNLADLTKTTIENVPHLALNFAIIFWNLQFYDCPFYIIHLLFVWAWRLKNVRIHFLLTFTYECFAHYVSGFIYTCGSSLSLYYCNFYLFCDLSLVEIWSFKKLNISFLPCRQYFLCDTNKELSLEVIFGDFQDIGPH